MKLPALLAAVALLLSPTVLAAPPQPYRADYNVYRNGDLLGRATVTLEAQGNGQWRMLSQTEGTEGLASLAGVSIVEDSRLQWTADDRPQTQSYTFAQKAAWRTRERSVSVDGRNIVSRDHRGEYPFPFRAGVLDRQAVTLAIMRDVAEGQRGDLTYWVVDRDDFGPNVYRTVGEETVAVPAGSLPAVKIERVRASGNGRTTTTWLGINQGFVPVRIVQREPDGDVLESKLVALRR